MLARHTCHNQRSAWVFLTVVALHLLLLYLLSIHGGKWLKPLLDTQPLTVSFVTEHASINTATKKDTLITDKNAQQQKTVSKRSPHTQTVQKAQPATEPPNLTEAHSRSDSIAKPTETLPTDDSNTSKRDQVDTPLEKKTSPHDKSTPDTADPLKSSAVTEPDNAVSDPADSDHQNRPNTDNQPSHQKTKTRNNEPQSDSSGINDFEPFSKHVIPTDTSTPVPSKSTIPDPLADKSLPKKPQPNADKTSEYDEYDASLKSFLDGLDELPEDEAGQATDDAHFDDNWGKLSNSEDSRVQALYKNRVKAIYPPEEKAVGREGIVVFEFEIDPSGKAIEQSINVVNATTDNFLREATIALLASEFKVTIHNGVMQNQYAKVAITFSLDDLPNDPQ